MKKRDIKVLKSEWGTYEMVLDALRKLIQYVSLLSFAIRAPSYNDVELEQLDLLARDVVCSLAGVLFVSVFLLRSNIVLRVAPASYIFGPRQGPPYPRPALVRTLANPCFQPCVFRAFGLLWMASTWLT